MEIYNLHLLFLDGSCEFKSGKKTSVHLSQTIYWGFFYERFKEGSSKDMLSNLAFTLSLNFNEIQINCCKCGPEMWGIEWFVIYIA